MDEVLSPGQQIKATLEIGEVLELLKTHYGIDTQTVVELDAYDDRNYRVELTSVSVADNPYILDKVPKHGYILKIINSLDSKDTQFYEAQSELLVFLEEKGIVCPIPVKQRDGAYFSTVTLKSGKSHLLRLLIFQPGEILGNLAHVSAALLSNLGSFAATLNLTLQGFSHPGYANRTSLWILQAVTRLRRFVSALKSDSERELVESIVREFEARVLPVHESLDRGIIHGDLNESNVLVGDSKAEISGVIDFGDSHVNCYVFELAVCLCYMITKANDLGMARHVIDGYKSVRPLTAGEREILKVCVCARFAQSLTLGAYSHSREPGNLYLVRDADDKWALLRKLWKTRESRIRSLWGIDGDE
ncbi:hydroxylysine kinase [Copidosoma floridanum]|uniref:hydroxylysine kinase n=1 Tax=Copidosoma floridanum TaxID=29053 RepID=UPI0006C99B92|nr:hydroxylysine kinase [Copidosoma floridanum]